MIDWMAWRKCQVCKALTGQPCTTRRIDCRRPLRMPHKSRQRRSTRVRRSRAKK